MNDKTHADIRMERRMDDMTIRMGYQIAIDYDHLKSIDLAMLENLRRVIDGDMKESVKLSMLATIFASFGH